MTAVGLRFRAISRGASKAARAVAEHLVRKVVGTGVAPRVRVEAAVMVAWGLLGRWHGRRHYGRDLPPTPPT